MESEDISRPVTAWILHEEDLVFINSLKSPELVNAATVFANSFRHIELLGSLPHSLIAHGVGHRRMDRHVFEVLLQSRNAEDYLNSTDGRARLDLLIREQFQKQIEKEGLEKLALEIRSFLQEFLEADPDRWASLKALRRALVPAVWATFEAMAKDAWIAALNGRPETLGSDAISAISSEAVTNDLGPKNISVRLLSKYRFDLRQNLGDVLCTKFDFTGVSGIKEAYSGAFGRRKRFDEFFDNESLKLLEATRHLIVHRSGIVDEEFNRRTHSSSPVGAVLDLTATQVGLWTQATLVAGRQLLEFIEDLLAAPTGLSNGKAS